MTREKKYRWFLGLALLVLVGLGLTIHSLGGPRQAVASAHRDYRLKSIQGSQSVMVSTGIKSSEGTSGKPGLPIAEEVRPVAEEVIVPSPSMALTPTQEVKGVKEIPWVQNEKMIPPIPRTLLESVSPVQRAQSHGSTKPVSKAVASGRYRFRNMNQEVLRENPWIIKDSDSKEYDLSSFSPKNEDIDLVLGDNIVTGLTDMAINGFVWTDFYFQGHKLLGLGDKLTGKAQAGKKRDRVFIQWDTVILKSGKSLPIRALALSMDKSVGVEGDRVGNLFVEASGSLFTELVRGVAESFKSRYQRAVDGSAVIDATQENLKNSGITGGQRVLDKLAALMAEDLEENKPYLFVRAGTRCKARLESPMDLSLADYGK